MQKEIKNDVLVGDAVRLRQVILNLLSNAIKFTPSGRSVTIEITEDSATETDATFTIRVIDQGIGIAEEDQQRIFESFEQLGSDYSKSQGTGLDLAISKSIVQLMGGELKLHSKKGEGTKFFFAVTLPKGYLNEDIGSEKLNGVDSFEGAHILIAEDNDLNAEIVIELLQRKGADVSRAENGKIALEMFKESRMGYFDVILMDIMMPEMNGLETTEAIRALSRPDAQTVPIIAMTANAFKEDEEQAMRSGMSGFISKPIDVAYLYEKLGEAFDSLWNRKE